MQKLTSAIMGTNGKNLDDLSHMDGKWWVEQFFKHFVSIILEFVHTSDLENVNSLILKYCPKKISYGWLGMLVRSALAAIDYNENIHREIKLDATGEPRYKMKVRVHNKTQVMFQTIFCML